jgi:hypothetical protein
MDTQDQPITPTVMLPSALEAQTKAEYDVAIVTAHRFPRSISSFLKRAESLATATPEIAAAMEYAKPVGGQKVKGPSARLAEIIAATYGNLRIQSRIISETNDQVVAQGIAHDLETNVAQSTDVTVSLLKKDGTRVGPESVANARGSACSKARRNATYLVVPQALCLPIIAAARKVAAGDEKTLPQRRKALLDWFATKGVKLTAILEWLDVKAVEDIGLEHMADLIAAQNTAKEEGGNLAEVFAAPRGDRMKDDFGTAKMDTRIVDIMTKAMSNGLGGDQVLEILLKHGGTGETIQARIAKVPAAAADACIADLTSAMMAVGS